MSITAKELAKKLSLSEGAVSLALNRKPGVSTATRKRVLEAAEKNGYDFARISEKQSAGGFIYFMIYKKHGAVVSDSPFFSELSEGIERGCKRSGYRLRISYLYRDPESADRELQEIVDSGCIGMILLGTEMTRDDFSPFAALTIPVVLLDTSFITANCSSVLIDNVQGAYTACEYLIRKRKQQPGYLRSAYPISNFNERADGFYRAVKENGMSAKKSIVHLLTPSIDGAYADMLALLEQGEELAPCYFADNDLIAIGALRAFRQKKYRIPEDIAIIGFDDIPASGFIEPGLTTMHVPKHDMGEAAARQLILLLHKPGISPTKTQLATRLVKRHTI